MHDLDTPATKADTTLRSLARQAFGELYQAELRMLHAAATEDEAFCGPNKHLAHPSNNPQFSVTGSTADSVERWGKDREIRAELIRWLFTSEAAKLLDPSGIWVTGARIVGTLHLAAVIVPVPLLLRCCRLMNVADFEGCQLNSLDLYQNWTRDLQFHFATVLHSLRLGRVHVEGRVNLSRTRIAQDLDLASALVTNPTGVAIQAEGLSVGGYAFLGEETVMQGDPRSFRAEGRVSMLNTTIGADLDFTGAQLSNPGSVALVLERSAIGGGLYMTTRDPTRNFQTDGIVDLRGSRCGLFEDDIDHAPPRGELRLDNFTYGDTGGDGWDAATRIAWLARDTSTATQPYRQLAKVFR
jgi:hypothetical protein